MCALLWFFHLLSSSESLCMYSSCEEMTLLQYLHMAGFQIQSTTNSDLMTRQRLKGLFKMGALKKAVNEGIAYF